MTDILTPNAKQQFFDNNGNPAVGYKLFTYAAGTTTKLATHTDSTGGSSNSNPVIMDFRGEAGVWLPPNVAYKFVFTRPTDTDPPTNPIWTVDRVVSSQLITLYGGVDTGGVNAYILTFNANFSAYADGIVLYWIPANPNTGASTVNVNGLGAIAIVNGDGTALVAGELQANLPATIIYKGGQFVLLTSILPANTGGSFTATVFGCTTAPTRTVTWARSGRMITLVVPSVGLLASNSTSFGLSGLPANLQTAVASTTVQVWGMLATDNSVAAYGSGDAFISAASGNINFQFRGGLWTAAGNKFMSGFVLTYPVASNFS